MTITNGYCTQAEFNAQMGLDDDYSEASAHIAINAASRAVDEYCHRRFYSDAQVSTVTYQADDPYRLIVQDFQTLTGLIVATDDGDTGSYSTTWTITTDFVARLWRDDLSGTPYSSIEAVGGRCFPVGGRRPLRVSVTHRLGWAAVPPEVTQATLIKAAQMFRRKDSPDGVAGGEGFGAIRITRYQDPTVAELLNPLVKVSRAALVL